MKLSELIYIWKNPLKFDINLKISKDFIKKSLEAARWAPSAENEQVWKFLAIDNSEKKEIVLKSVENQDSRLTSTLHRYQKPNLSARFVYSIENFEAKSDKYKNLIFESHPADIDCAKTASFFIICTHTRKIFALNDVGAAITNMTLMAKDLGFSMRWIRNFDREFIKEKFNLPLDQVIDSILAFGYPTSENNEFECINKNIEDFFFHNIWNNTLDISDFSSEKQNINEYNIETVDTILDRRSVRSYIEDQKISKSIVYELIKAALMIPLAISKPYIKIIVIDDEKILKEVAKSAKIVINRHVQQVPLIIAIAFDCSINSPAFYAAIDTGAIIQNILLRAHSFGIGSCWIGAFSRNVIRKVLNIEENWFIPTIAIFGYPNEYPKPTPRKDLAKICYYNEWNARVQERHRSILPNYHIPSIMFRKVKKTRVKTPLRQRKVGEIIGIPEFEKLIKNKKDN